MALHPVLVDISLGSLELSLSLSIAVAALLGALFTVLITGATRLGWVAALALVGFSAPFVYQSRGIVWNVDGLVLSSFGTCLFVGGALATWLVVRGAERQGIGPDITWRALLLPAAAALLGARVVYATINASAFANAWDIMAIGSGGLSLLGGLVLALGATLGVLARSRVCPLLWGDIVIAPLLCLATWVCAGSYLAGAEQGLALGDSAPRWLSHLGTFPRWPPQTLPGLDGPPVLLHQVASGVVPLGAPASAPVHPTQLYEAVALLSLLGVVVTVSRHRRRRGEPLMIGALGYSLCRLLIEMVRGDADRGLLPVTLSKLAWVALFAVPVVLALFYLSARRRAEPARAIAWAVVGTAFAALVYVLPSEVPSFTQVACGLVAVGSAVALGIWSRHAKSIGSSP